LQKETTFFDRSNIPEGFKQFQLDCPSYDNAGNVVTAFLCSRYCRVSAKELPLLESLISRLF